MLQETSMLYKLTILYLLNRVDHPISGNSLSNFLLQNDFTDYFNLQQIMGELIDDGYVTKEAARNKTLYRISESGEAAIRLLERELAPSMREEIEKYITDNGMELKEDLSVMAKYYQESINSFIANMYIEEAGEKLLEMNISVPTEADAEHICSKWYNSSDKLYPIIMKELLG
ncbi:MAG: DUF4364 family protein [Lachnospiraceae bacterium]|nr:DUF4364 family protein [Lachnospiraceae bacterium]